MAGSHWVPNIGWVVTMPEPLINSKAFIRLHKRISKEAAVVMLKAHQVRRLPRHFKTTARQIYNHWPRKAKYKEIKKAKYGSVTDLVKTGRLKAHVLGGSHRVQVGGDAINGLRARMFISMPFPMDMGVMKHQQVSPSMMAEEIARFSPQDTEEAARDYEHYYFAALAEGIDRSPNWKKQIGATVAGKLA